MTTQTPVMAQYQRIKSQYRDAILFFRMGDFYEMFFEDARVASRELEIALTARDKNSDEPIPLAGIPHQTYQTYAARLLKRGYKIAICEQVSDPRNSKGIVDREVVRVLTPGTVTEDTLLESAAHNYLLSIACRKNRWALAYLDMSTGDASITGVTGEDALDRLAEEVVRLAPSELVVARDLPGEAILRRVQAQLGLRDEAISSLDGGSALDLVELPASFGVAAGYRDEPEKLECLRLLIHYVTHTLGAAFSHFSGLQAYALEECLVIDPGSIRNLDLLENSRERTRRGSLFWVLDRTHTAMGARLLRKWITSPLIHPEQIERRLDGVAAMVGNHSPRQELARLLSRVHDIPRILSKVSSGIANARDLVGLGNSLEVVPGIEACAREAGLPDAFSRLGDFVSLKDALLDRLVEAPPLTITEGGLFREGIIPELDELREMSRDARGFVARLEESERQRTGIRSLRIKYNRVFGYFIEITRSNLQNVPPDYQRKQSMSTAERFVTPMLKEKETEIMQAEERSEALEYEAFAELRDQVREALGLLKDLSSTLAALDVFVALAGVAVEHGYVRPRLCKGSGLRVVGGRHPVVERMLRDDTFIPNDLRMSLEDSQVILVTGPNMAGKSTFLRQTALLVLMAQMGSFVPAESMELGLVDRIFTRVGASDDLASGQSTFMVEMQETSYILRNATSQSLVILDEVGRGTSTYDGLSLAWAIVEYLYRTPTLRPRTLFATHYHELTELADLYPGIANLSTRVLEKGDKVIFLHKVGEGFADKSYGIHVARLAELPVEVLDRAKEILFELERDEERSLEKKKRRMRSTRSPLEAEQLLLFDPAVHPVLEEIRALDLDALSPLEALNTLARFKARL